MKQVEKMRELYLALNGDRGLVIAEYAAAEMRGEVQRRSNKQGWSAETYAQALWNDGLRKGWLTD